MSGLPLVRSPARALKRWVSSGVAAARRRNLALLQEGIRDRNRLIEQSARIVAQVDDEGLEPVAGLGREIGYRLLQVPAILVVEQGDADIADDVHFGVLLAP